jgi:DNA anti-recombination protein RmuC
VSIAISFLAVIIAGAAFWFAYELSSKQKHWRQELVNDHAVEITRLQNGYNDELGRLKQKFGILDGELQAYRQEFRQATRTNHKDIERLNVFCEKFGHTRTESSNSGDKPKMS